jgi:large subunit ribosomal protein L21
MYAVLSSGGKQYRVEAGSTLELERLTAEPGATITFDRVLLLADGDRVTVGTPLVEGATVSGTVLGEALGPKLVIFKFRQKVKYRRKRGHRQHLTRVRIDAINADGRREERAQAAKPERVPEPEVAPAAQAGTTVAEEAEATKPKAPSRRRSAKAAAEALASPEAAAQTEASVQAESSAEEEAPKPKRAARPRKSTAAKPAEEK